MYSCRWWEKRVGPGWGRHNINIIDKITTWSLEKFLPMGPAGLFILAFAESSFFPVPPDILLIALALARPESSFFLASICTAGSVIGGMFGYLIGRAGGRPLLERFVSKEKIDRIHTYFNKYEAWAVGIAGFTPIPYKVFTIAGGVFYINFPKFVIVSALSRGARFFLVATTIFFFGPAIREYVQKYFDIFSIVFILLLVLGFAAVRLFSSRKKARAR